MTSVPRGLHTLEEELRELERTNPEVRKAKENLDEARRDIVTGRLTPDGRHSQHCQDAGEPCSCSASWRRRHGLPKVK